MCGICGIYNYQSGESVAESVLRSMATVITHRGPDDEGFHVEPSIGLGMRRLSIIDLATGQQPLYSEDKRFALVCNGEIYNFRELRDELTARGHQFCSRSDSEVIVHLYEELETQCVERLRGMFAFAVWDSLKQRLFLARDRIGIKPLYIADHEGTLLFASEIKSILQWKKFPREIDPAGLHHYLSLNYVPAPYTLIRGIRQVPPAGYAVADRNGVREGSYWDLRFISTNSFGEAEWSTKVHDRLQEAVDSHLVSDVPFGAFLSGGIDSSAIVAMMARTLDQPVSTFSMDFREKSFSEGRYAKKVADQYKSDHHVMTASPDVVHLLQSLIWYADDPLADSSMIPVFLISEFAKKYVTMVLTGDGGDEVFAGYETYNAYYVLQMYRKIPPMIRRHIVKRLVDSLPVSLSKVSFDFKAKRFVEGAELDDEEAHFWWRVIFTETAKSALYTRAFREKLDAKPTKHLYKEYFGRSQSDDPLSRMLYVDTRFYLPNDMLVKVDRMTMANALEARVPFLDHEFVEFAATIPSSIKFKRRSKKYILKKALSPLLDREILYRKKAGFNVPVNAWLAGQLRDYARSILAPDRIASVGFFEPSEVERLLREHEARKFDHSFCLWGLICFQLWHEMFISASSVVPPAGVARRWGLEL